MSLAGFAQWLCLQTQPGQFPGIELAKAVAFDAVRSGEDRPGIVADAAGVVQQHPDSDGPAALPGNEVGQIAAYRSVQLDVSLADFLEDTDRGEGLGDAADPVSHLGSGGAPGVDVGDSRSALPFRGAISHRRVSAVHPCVMESLECCIQRCPVDAGSGGGPGGGGVA